MKTTNILVLGKHPDILKTILRLINKIEHWDGEGAGTEQEVLEKCQHSSYDILLLDVGVSINEEKMLRKELAKIAPDLKIIQHFGGGSGLLFNEIQAVIDGFTKVDFKVKDNANS